MKILDQWYSIQRKIVFFLKPLVWVLQVFCFSWGDLIWNIHITRHELMLRSCPESEHWFPPLHPFWLGTHQWADHFSPHLKDTTTHLVGEGKFGLASTNQCVPPCGRWCLTLMVSHWTQAHQSVCSQPVISVGFTDIVWLGRKEKLVLWEKLSHEYLEKVKL